MACQGFAEILGTGMAQWIGQYTGNTHGTKAADLEHLLRHAVEVFKASSVELKPTKAKLVKKLAAKVLNARLKVVKAKLSETMPVEAKDWESRRVQVEHLQTMETNLLSADVAGILIEFDAAELAADDRDTEKSNYTN